MRREFYLYIRNGMFYAELTGPKGQRIATRSTGKRNRDAAAAVVGQWLKDGLPSLRKGEPPRSINEILSLSVILHTLKKTDLTVEDGEKIIGVLKARSLLDAPGCESKKTADSAYAFMLKFWNFDQSPYVREKLLHGQGITRRHCRESIRQIERYWKTALHSLILEEIKRPLLNNRLLELAETGLAPSSVNKAYAAVSTPLRWAAENALILEDPTTGIMRFSGNGVRRGILTPEEVKSLFETFWPDPRGRVAFAVAVTTGARLGEIRALRLPDIGEDRLFIRHGWNDDDRLKAPKNGEAREVPLLPPIRDAILDLARENPFGINDEHFILYGSKRDRPIDAKYLLQWYKNALQSIGIDETHRKSRNLVFHGLRHVYAKTMADRLDSRAVMRTTGHKTAAVFESYANHTTEDDFRKVGAVIADLYSKVIPFRKVSGGEL